MRGVLDGTSLATHSGSHHVFSDCPCRARAALTALVPHPPSQHIGTINASVRGAGANLSTAFASTTLRDLF
jgi:hypothetical protein